MRINVREDVSKRFQFKNLEGGDVFLQGEVTYVKLVDDVAIVGADDDVTYNAMCLVDGTLEYFLNDEFVVLPKSIKCDIVY